MTPTDVLVIEDDPKIAEAVRQGLRGEGFDVSVARTGDDGLLRLQEHSFDLVVLDWMLPGRDGIAICRGCASADGRLPCF